MTPTVRALIIGLLIQLQLFAPLLHAHAGSEPSPGIAHVPGLEHLQPAAADTTATTPHFAEFDAVFCVSPGLSAPFKPAASEPVGAPIAPPMVPARRRAATLPKRPQATCGPPLYAGFPPWTSRAPPSRHIDLSTQTA